MPSGNTEVGTSFMRMLRSAWWKGPAIATALFLTGCATPPRGVLLPVQETVPGASQVSMLVATTRLRDIDPEEYFSGERGPSLSFASFTVSIPPEANRKAG